MKRKFILYPAVALALMASASLSSCVDTDEPESLEALRNAKAEEVRANAGLINAKTAVENAYVAVVNANAAQQEAEARRLAAVAAEAEYNAAVTKATTELAIAKTQAASEAEIATAKLEAEITLNQKKTAWEEEVYKYKDAVAKWQNEINKIEATYKKDFADWQYENNDLQELRTALRTLKDAQADLADANLALADAMADNNPEDDVADAQRVYDLAVSNKEAAEAMFSSLDIAKITEEYNALKAKKDNVEWTKKEYDLKLAKLKNEKTDLESPLGDGTSDGLIKTFNDKNTALTNAKNANSGKEAAYKNSTTGLEVACSNTVLQAAIGNEVGAFKTYEKGEDGKWKSDKSLNGIFKYDEKNKKYVAVLASDKTKAIQVRQDDVESATAELRKLFNAFTTKTTQNPKDYDVAVAKLTGAASHQLNDVIGKDNKSLLRGEWYTQVTNFNNAKSKNKADLYDETQLKAAIQALFGTDYDWKIFTTSDAFNDVEQWIKDSGKDVDYSKLGEYGKWKKLVQTQNNLSSETEFTSDASKAVGDIDKYKKDYDKTVEEKHKEDANVNNVDAVKKAQQEFDEAKKAKEDQEAKVKAKADEIAAVTKEQKAVATDSLNAYNNILTALEAFSVEYGEVTVTAKNFEKTKNEALEKLNKDVDEAAEKLAEKKEDLEKYKAGRFDKGTAIRNAQEAVRDAERAVEDAQADYDRINAKLAVNY